MPDGGTPNQNEGSRNPNIPRDEFMENFHATYTEIAKHFDELTYENRINAMDTAYHSVRKELGDGSNEVDLDLLPGLELGQGLPERSDPSSTHHEMWATQIKGDHGEQDQIRVAIRMNNSENPAENAVLVFLYNAKDRKIIERGQPGYHAFYAYCSEAEFNAIGNRDEYANPQDKKHTKSLKESQVVKNPDGTINVEASNQKLKEAAIAGIISVGQYGEQFRLNNNGVSNPDFHKDNDKAKQDSFNQEVRNKHAFAQERHQKMLEVLFGEDYNEKIQRYRENITITVNETNQRVAQLEAENEQLRNQLRAMRIQRFRGRIENINNTDELMAFWQDIQGRITSGEFSDITQNELDEFVTERLVRIHGQQQQQTEQQTVQQISPESNDTAVPQDTHEDSSIDASQEFPEASITEITPATKNPQDNQKDTSNPSHEEQIDFFQERLIQDTLRQVINEHGSIAWLGTEEGQKWLENTLKDPNLRERLYMYGVSHTQEINDMQNQKAEAKPTNNGGSTSANETNGENGSSPTSINVEQAENRLDALEKLGEQVGSLRDTISALQAQVNQLQNARGGQPNG